jgi:hypothetical protein
MEMRRTWIHVKDASPLTLNCARCIYFAAPDRCRHRHAPEQQVALSVEHVRTRPDLCGHEGRWFCDKAFEKASHALLGVGACVCVTAMYPPMGPLLQLIAWIPCIHLGIAGWHFLRNPKRSSV